MSVATAAATWDGGNEGKRSLTGSGVPIVGTVGDAEGSFQKGAEISGQVSAEEYQRATTVWRDISAHVC